MRHHSENGMCICLGVFRFSILALMIILTVGSTNVLTGADDEKAPLKRPAVLFIGVVPRQMHTWNDWLEAGFEIDAKTIGAIKSVADLVPYNAVVVNFLPQWGMDGKPKPELIRLEKILDKYMRQGGGVVVFCGGGGWSTMHPSLTHLLKPYGAETRNEQVTDPKSLQGKVHGHLDVCYTTKITKAPLTEGVNRIGYIGKASRADCIKTMQPVVLLKPDQWQVIVRGENSAYSAEGLKPGATSALKKTPATYSSSPIMAACRQVDKGRLFVYPQNVAFTVTSPDVFENVLWQKDPKGKKALQNRQLNMQIIRWAAEPSLNNLVLGLGGFKTNRETPFDRGAILNYKKTKPIDWSKIKVGGKFGSIKGLIGAQSQHSGQKHSIAELSKAAKDAGLSFLGFTEALEKIDAKKWEKIKADCLKNSDSNFQAIPGMLARDKVGNLWFALGHVSFPKYPAISEDGKLIDNTYQFWAKCFNNRISGFVDPLSNPNPWYEMKHTSGMSVFTWKNGKLTENAIKEYLLSCSKAENYLPISFTLINTPAEITNAKNRILNVFTGQTVDDLKNYVAGTGKFKRNLYWASPHKWYLSKGPELVYDGGYNLGNLNCDEEKQNVYRYGFKITNLIPGDKVFLYDGDDKLREWVANESTFTAEHTWPHEQQRHLVIQVMRNGQLVMLSAPVLLHIGPRFNQCGDRQNTLPYNYALDRNGNSYVTGIPIGAHYRSWTPHTLVYGNFKVWQTGAVGIEAQPPMYMSYNTSPHIPLAGKDMVGGSSLASYQYPKLACPGIIIVDEICHRMYPNNGRHVGDCRPPKKTEDLQTFNLYQRRYGLYGLMDQVNGQYVDSKITVLKDCTLANGGTMVRVSHFTYPIKPGTRKNAEIFANGGITRYPFNMMPKFRRNDIMKPGDYAGIYPHGVVGGGAQYAVSGNLKSMINHKLNSKHFGDLIYLTVPNQWKKDNEFKYSLLFTTGGSVPAQQDSEYLQVVNFLGLRNNQFPAISKITGGKLLPIPVIATIETKPDSTLTLETREYPDAPLALPLRVRGYNPNWQVVYTLNGSKIWRYCGQLDQDFYFSLYSSLSPCNVIMGHPLTADNKDVVIALDDPLGKQSAFEIYNPTDKEMVVNLKTNPVFLPEKTISVTLKPLVSKRVRVDQ